MTFCEFIEATTRLAYFSLIEPENPDVKKDIRVEISAEDVAKAIPRIVDLYKVTLDTKKKAPKSAVEGGDKESKKKNGP
jgi:hypothetical protein